LYIFAGSFGLNRTPWNVNIYFVFVCCAYMLSIALKEIFVDKSVQYVETFKKSLNY